MTIYEFLKSYEDVMRVAHRNGIAVEHTRFLPIYADWQKLMREGEKKQYAETVISDRYGYKPRYIRMIVKFMSEIIY